MLKARKLKKLKEAIVAQPSQGAEWLAHLNEQVFRDEILKELFYRMKRRGDLLAYRYTHGRYEHGIDWIVQDKSAIGTRFLGIQAKSKNITKQGNYQSDSALTVKLQCESAYEHSFEFEGSKIRLDNVELWTSAHITEDGESAFSADFSRNRVKVKKAEQIYSLIEAYCPNIIKKIPVLAVSGYLVREANPSPMPIKILGCQLNPKIHFIEPSFSKSSEMSPSRFLKPRKGKAESEKQISLDDVMRTKGHYLIVGSELSGKTYLLRRLSCIYAERGVIPIFVAGDNLVSSQIDNTPKLIKNKIDWLTLQEIEDPKLLTNSFALLIDDADKLPEDQLINLTGSSHGSIQIICTRKTPTTHKQFQNYFIAGVDLSSISNFVRSLDIDEKKSKALTDRVTSFVNRTLLTSGLPSNPFIISAILAECKIAHRRLATPTMGRLVERFVEEQIGSYSENSKTDFETKRQFLTDLAGHKASEFGFLQFEKLIAKFIAEGGHPHTKDDFRSDLLDSGVVSYDEANKKYLWTHNVFKEFFWVRNLVREKKYGPIAKKLTTRASASTAAVAGSQMGN